MTIANNDVSLLIFTCQGREHLLEKTYKSFIAACDFPFAYILLAIDGTVNSAVIDHISPDLVVYNYKRKGYVNSIKNALLNIKTPYFFWLEDDWLFPQNIAVAEMLNELQENDDWAEIVLSKYGPLSTDLKALPIKDNLYQTTFGFSANPCICNTRHLQNGFQLLANAPKGDKLGEDGFENFLSKTFDGLNIKCVIADPVDHIPVLHEGYLESTPRNWHMTNSLEEKTSAHLLTIPSPSVTRKLTMVLKLYLSFLKLATGQLFSDKVYELCFRIIAMAKTIKKDE